MACKAGTSRGKRCNEDSARIGSGPMRACAASPNGARAARRTMPASKRYKADAGSGRRGQDRFAAMAARSCSLQCAVARGLGGLLARNARTGSTVRSPGMVLHGRGGAAHEGETMIVRMRAKERGWAAVGGGLLLMASTAIQARGGLPDFTILVKESSPAVVNISTTQRLATMPSHGFGLPDVPEHHPLQPFIERFRAPGGTAPEQQFDTESLGSGF